MAARLAQTLKELLEFLACNRAVNNPQVGLLEQKCIADFGVTAANVKHISQKDGLALLQLFSCTEAVSDAGKLALTEHVNSLVFNTVADHADQVPEDPDFPTLFFLFGVTVP